jgi:hypothetical protein
MRANSPIFLTTSDKKKRVRHMSNPTPVLPFDRGEGARSEEQNSTWVRLPLRTNNGLNAREHWAARSQRVKKERTMAWQLVPRIVLPCEITLVRISPGTLDDDNLRGALKGVRDGIADKFGIDDRDPRVTWVYRQEREKGYAVRVELRAICVLTGSNF